MPRYIVTYRDMLRYAPREIARNFPCGIALGETRCTHLAQILHVHDMFHDIP